jgi:FkbM family methyltransferase
MIDRYLATVLVRGIIQAGSNSGQEVPIFLKYTDRMILCEPISQHSTALAKAYPQALVLGIALGSTDFVGTLHIASNAGESSSLLQPADHLVHYRGIRFTSDASVSVRRFDSVAKDMSLDMFKYNVLITDCQGYDLEVIKGFGELITGLDLIVCEYINTPLYLGNASLSAIKEWLDGYGFVLLETSDECLGAGNAFFGKAKK